MTGFLIYSSLLRDAMRMLAEGIGDVLVRVL